MEKNNEYSREVMATYVSTHPEAMKQTRNLKELSIFFNDRMFRMEDLNENR